jgi:imidazolonepropionase-like amidohydrolase
MGGSRNLPYAAGYAVAYGLPYDEALKAITLNPAEMFGLGDKLGSLDVGKTANVVVANGDPLDVRTSVKQVFIEGNAVPMVSRQTRLRDEYMPLTNKKP